MKTLADAVKRIPVLGPISRNVYRSVFRSTGGFPGSNSYWEQRYVAGGNSGAGSYNRLAEFKAEVLNRFVAEHDIRTVVEFGCGDGNQLGLAEYPEYLGFDVSPTAIEMCRARFAGDPSKTFSLYDDRTSDDVYRLGYDLSLSLDVIYHLVEDEVFEQYMQRLFDAASRHVIVYSSNFESARNFHQRDRKFTDWVARCRPSWRLVNNIPNRYPCDRDAPNETSKADFFFFERRTAEN